MEAVKVVQDVLLDINRARIIAPPLLEPREEIISVPITIYDEI